MTQPASPISSGPPACDVAGDPLFTLGGRYDFRLRRAGTGHTWRIVGLVATAQWATGNQRIMQLAAEKSRARPQPPPDFE